MFYWFCLGLVTRNFFLDLVLKKSRLLRPTFKCLGFAVALKSHVFLGLGLVGMFCPALTSSGFRIFKLGGGLKSGLCGKD